MAYVIEFPSGTISVQDVLDKGAEMNLETAFLIGIDEEGILLIASNNNEPMRLNWMLDRVKDFILTNF